MKNKVFFLFLITLSFFKAFSQDGHSYPLMPYLLLDKSKLDTTFRFEYDEKPLSLKLSKKLFGKKVIGALEYFVQINNEKQIVGLIINNYQIFKKKKIIADFERKIFLSDSVLNKINTQIQDFLMKERKFIQTKPITKEVHLTYCFLRIHK